MDMKPPISRAKMILITKAAIKAIKLYKHVVQIVEKFIKKCKPEYKVPGLYVIDSIVRQSRHQFGTDKDVFGPRFSKNITATFQYLYLCPSEDKSKIVRVLNLWQKNGVFKIEIIQPLLDMAAGTSNAVPVADNVTNNEGSPPPPVKASSELAQVPTNSMPPVAQLPSSDAFAAVAQLFQTTQGQQLQQILQTFQQPPKPQSPALDNAVMAQVQAITAQLKTAPTQPPEQKAAFPPPEQKTAFDKVPFGYPGDSMQQPAYTQHQNMDQFPPRMMGIQQDAVHHQVPLPPNGQMPGFGLLSAPPFPPMPQPGMAQPGMPQPGMPQPGMAQPGMPQPGMTQPGLPQPGMAQPGMPQPGMAQPGMPQPGMAQPGMPQSGIPPTPPVQPTFQPTFQPQNEPLSQKPHQQEMEVDQPCVPEAKRHVPDSRKSRSRSASRQDAYRALQKLSRGNYKVNQKSIKIAWALNKGIKADYKQYWDVELGVTYVPWDKVKPEELESFCEGGMLDGDTLNPEWKGIPKKPENEVAQNGGGEASHTEPVSPVPKTLPVPVPPIPVPAPITVPPPQVPPHQPGPPVVGALQPPAFTPPLGIPPPGFGPGVPPPPPPPPFLRPGFNPMHLPPGFLPPGPPPPITPPVSIPPPHTPPISIPNSTIAGINEDTTKDLSIGNPIPTVVSGARGNAESADSAKMYGSAVPPAAPTNLPTPPVTQPVSLLGRDQERFGRRSFGNRVENDRERYGNRNDDRDNSNRERREWGRRSPDRDRHRDLEDRNRRSSGHRDRDRDSRDRESRREKEDNRREKHELTDRAGSNKASEPPLSQVGDVDTVSELDKGEAMAAVVKPSEESPAEATSSVEPEKDSGSAAEAPR
ncbi:SR-related CTD-associated factor 4 [Cricetulus griseus]